MNVPVPVAVALQYHLRHRGSEIGSEQPFKVEYASILDAGDLSRLLAEEFVDRSIV